MKNYRLFFSWQNEEPKAKSIIFKALNKAIKDLKKKDIEIELDQDTRKRVGVKKIDDEVIAKITHCDIFVADLTPVYTKPPKTDKGLARHMPNSNVLYEFGYAMGIKGLDHTLLLAKMKRGQHVELMPFDIKTFTITSFNKIEDLAGLATAMQKICELVDEERANVIPEYLADVFFVTGKSAEKRISITPTYIEYCNKKSVPQQNPLPNKDDKDIMKAVLKGGMAVYAESLTHIVKPDKIRVITKHVFHGDSYVQILLCNRGNVALENVGISIIPDNTNVKFYRSNEKDVMGLWDIPRPDETLIKEDKVSDHYDILNPQSQYSLRHFYVYVPHGIRDFKLLWHVSTKTGNFDGELDVSVEPQYRYELSYRSDLHDGDIWYDDYVENVTADDGDKRTPPLSTLIR